MFTVVRSIFWLTVAYMVIKPGVEMPDTQALSAQAMAAGSQIIAEQIQAIECDSLQCFGGKAIAAAALQPNLPAPAPQIAVQDDAPTRSAPVPRPRPDWAG